MNECMPKFLAQTDIKHLDRFGMFILVELCSLVS